MSRRSAAIGIVSIALVTGLALIGPRRYVRATATLVEILGGLPTISHAPRPWVSLDTPVAVDLELADAIPRRSGAAPRSGRVVALGILEPGSRDEW